MDATKESEKLCAVLGKGVAGKLNLAAKVVATDSECAGWTREDGKAVQAAQQVMRTKGEAPSVAVGKLDAADLVAFGSKVGGESAVLDA